MNQEIKLPVCDKLIKDEVIRTDKYCAPVFIASSFFGTFLTEDENLIPEEFTEKSIRNGTMTFISYKNIYYAITCAHVLDSLEKKQKKWKKDKKHNTDLSLPIEGYELFTPVGKNQFHFNYKLTKIKKDINGNSPDVAIARINYHSVKRLKRQAITLTKKKTYPETGIASGYPEMQREIKHGKYVGTFSAKFTTCTATLQVTGNGGLLIQDSIDDNNGLNNLSGMSGGPLIWTDSEKFGLAGIVKLGFDIEPQIDGLMTEDSIWIHGEKITPEIFEKWLESVPDLKELKDETKHLIVPEGMNK